MHYNEVKSSYNTVNLSGPIGAEAKRLPEIQAAMQQLSVSVSELEKRMEGLEMRLSSVRNIPPETLSKGEAAPSFATPLASSIHESVSRLHALERRLSSLERSIEL